MNNKRKKSVGSKIILLGKIVSTIGIVLMFLFGTILLAAFLVLLIFALINEPADFNGDIVFTLLWSGILSGLSLYISGLFIHGYGKIVENSDSLVELTAKIADKDAHVNLPSNVYNQQVAAATSEEQTL